MNQTSRIVQRIYAPSGDVVAESVGDNNDAKAAAWLEACEKEGSECSEADGYELIPIDQVQRQDSGEWIDAEEFVATI